MSRIRLISETIYNGNDTSVHTNSEFLFALFILVVKFPADGRSMLKWIPVFIFFLFYGNSLHAEIQ